jgi:stearoyl-CoA desaturase (delta-9 desaturase)
VRSPLQRWRDALFILTLHAIPAAAVMLGTTRSDWIACAAFYVVAAMGTGIGLHRYFAHRAFRTSRAIQLVLALLACTAFAEPLGFAGKHRLHHRHADTAADVHSPRQGFWFCWLGSLVDEGYTERELLGMAPDLVRFPELVWLHRWFWAPGVALGAATWLVGGFSMFAIGFCLSRVLLLHLVSTVNYFCHSTGTRRFDTRDASTNNLVVALLTFGEGWHNNHHRYPWAARAGFRWWEIDPVWYAIKLLAWLRLVWDVRDAPAPSVDSDMSGATIMAGR